MTRDRVIEIFKRFAKLRSAPSTELIYKTHFELLIAVMLSAQSTDKSVNKATRPLFALANTPEAILNLGIQRLENAIKTIGLYRTKAKHIYKTCEQLLSQHAGRVPNTRKALEALPGVGRKTANVILNTLFNEPTLAVDTHIFRVAHRIGLAHGTTPRQVEDQLMKVIPPPYLKDAHHHLILHGRYTCTARNPKCASCPIQDCCAFFQSKRMQINLD